MRMAIEASIHAVDWVTLTLPATSRPRDEMQWKKGLYSVQSLFPATMEPVQASWMGYSGFRLDSLFWGARRDSSIIRASGPIAHQLAYQLQMCGCKPSRVDLATTFLLSEDTPAFAADLLPGVLDAREGQPEARRRRVTMLQGLGDGDTLYIGSRASEQYGRIYDKSREQGHGGKEFAWRAEVEYKGDHARAIWELLRMETAKEAAVASLVYNWFTERGAALPRPDSTVLAIRPAVPARSPDDGRAFDWLSKQVAPVVERLGARYGRAAVEQAIWAPEEE